MVAYRLDLAYDGTGFRGYAANAGVRTVQGELDAALATALGGEVATTVAGRTDAGVHALGQVVSFEWPEPIDTQRVIRSVNSMLGGEVVVNAITETADDFSARFSATARRYHYLVDNRPTLDPLLRLVAWHVEQPLDLEQMNLAASGFIGEHDFASLCRAAEGRSTKRKVLEAAWSGESGVLTYDVAASSFCHQMVRSMVAICVDAGRSKIDPGSVPEILAARDRHAARGVAPPHGLTLWEVAY